LDAFFASYFRRRPVNASFVGMHAYDDRLPDLSAPGIAETLADADDLLARLRGLTQEPLSEAQMVDRQLAEGFLLIQRWESGSAHFGPAANPTLFTGEAVFGVVSVLERWPDMAAARLGAVPAFLDVAMRQITSAPQAWIERARRECEGARLLLADVAVEFPALERPARAAADAFQRFDQFLVDQVAPTQDYACGGEALELLLRAAHLDPRGPGGVEELALQRIAEEEETLSKDSSAPSASEHPAVPPPVYLETFDRWSEAVWKLARDHDLVSIPHWPVRFVERPVWARRAAPYLYFLPYRSPPPLDQPPVVEYLVPPGSDESTIKLNHVVHHGSLGHHVQNWFAARASSRIGQIAAVDCASRIALLCGGTMAEGWANYATDLVAEISSNADFLSPAEQHGQHRARLRMAARALVDIRLHQGRFTLEEAIEFYNERVGMEPAAAKAEAVKNSLFPGAACMYLIGWDGIWRLRRELERSTPAFSLRAFHDRLLSFGSIPVSLIARAMQGTTATSATVPALIET
jgi:uncharacterized protein DUF885